MAYIAQNPTSVKNPQFYNVHHAVGTGPLANMKRDDILLVQWMLHRISVDTTLPWTPPDDHIDIDGYSGPQTVRWIRSFQRMARERGNNIAVDGRVDHMTEGKPTGSISGTQYTILWMNIWIREDNPAVFYDPSSDPDMPHELLMALANNSPQSVAAG